MRDPRSGPRARLRDLAVLRAEDLLRRRPGGEWEQADGVALPGGGDAALERIWAIVPGEADGTVYAGGDPGVLFESRDGGATFTLNRGPLGASQPRPLAAGRRRAVPALDRDVARRARPARGRHLRRRRLADRRRRRDLAPRQRGPRRALPARRAARRTRSRSACTASSARRRGPSGSSCSSTAACTAPTTRARRGRASPPACRRTSASRWRVDPADPDSAYVIPLVADIDRVTPDGPRARVRDARRRRELDAARRRAARPRRVPHGPARGVRPARRGRGARALLRRDVGRRLRLGRRGGELVRGRRRTCRRCIGVGDRSS